MKKQTRKNKNKPSGSQAFAEPFMNFSSRSSASSPGFGIRCKVIVQMGLLVSASSILVVDRNNDCVHVIDRNGKFLRYINCSLKDPFVLSIDSDENLWVGECDEQNIKVIKYLGPPS